MASAELDGADLLRLTKMVVRQLHLSHDYANEALSIGIVGAVEGLRVWEQRGTGQATTYVCRYARWSILSNIQREVRQVEIATRLCVEAPTRLHSIDTPSTYVEYATFNAAFGQLEQHEQDVLSALAIGIQMKDICKRFGVNGTAITKMRSNLNKLLLDGTV